MKIAIIGAGVSGLSCALELERNGIIADVFERDHSVGWPWPTVGFWPEILLRDYGDIIKYLRENFDISIKPLMKCTNIIMKSKNQKVEINGNLGYTISRGKEPDSVENQIKSLLKTTPIRFSSPVDYKELSHKYDWVVVANGNDAIARDLGLWEDKDLIRITGGVAMGSFRPDSSIIYFNTDYAGTGYGWLAPFNKTQATIDLFAIGCGEFEVDRLFSKFLEYENLDHLEFLNYITPNPFSAGKLEKFQVGNILLTGRAAGLTERLLGVGAIGAILSGTYAARAIMNELDYESHMKKLAAWVENISAFRDIVNRFDNDDFDRLLASIGKPGIKQLIYNTHIDFVENIGKLLKTFAK
ncbi:MAG: NAD(P)/FAD-dependent oxidoreductase [Caulobacteraceae bacterium]